MTVEYLRDRAEHSSLEKFQSVLAKVPEVEPEDYDRLWLVGRHEGGITGT